MNHLRLILLNTRVQSCHEKFGCARVRMDNIVRVLYYPWYYIIHGVRNMHVGGMHYACIMFIISEDLNLAMFWRLKSLPNFPAIRYVIQPNFPGCNSATTCYYGCILQFYLVWKLMYQCTKDWALKVLCSTKLPQVVSCVCACTVCVGACHIHAVVIMWNGDIL